MLSEFATNHEFSLQAIHLLGILFTLIQNFWNNSNVLKKLFSILVECKLQKKHKVHNNPYIPHGPEKILLMEHPVHNMYDVRISDLKNARSFGHQY